MIEIRKYNTTESQNLRTQGKPEFISILWKSQAVSLMMGKSQVLTRIPKITKDKQKFQDLEVEKEMHDSKAKRLIA